MSMRIVRLTAENFKRLRAVEITPDGDVVVITGKNAAGKSSILDAIFATLAGRAATDGLTRPVRDGEEHAIVDLDLGQIRVTRTWNADGKTTLRVTTADGAKYDRPQKMLDGLIGKLSFDPLDFANADRKTQVAMLAQVAEITIDPEEIDRERAALFEQRTVVGRDRDLLGGKVNAYPEPAADVPDDEIRTADLLAEFGEARRVHDDHAGAVRRHAEARRRVDIAREELAAAEAALKQTPVPDASALPDLTAIEVRLAAVDEVNAAVRSKRERAELAARHEAKEQEYEGLTASIHALDERKAAAIRDAKMPVEGLGFDSDGVTYNGVPFTQASAAERLRVSLAVAMAANPEVRVIRITDGSLLDRDNMALIAEMATAHDYQVWLEVVGDDAEVGILIEDGGVVEAAAP